MSSSKTTMLDTILKLRYSGFSMIPSGRGKDGKAPAISWVDYQERLPSEEKIRKWFVRWSKQWGMVTGKISDIVVVDVDPGADISIMEGLEPHVRTPRDGGHYYFKHPGYAVKTTTGILPKIDIRGDGGFVNVVGTNPKTGGKYTIEIMPTRDALYTWDRMPKAILEAMEKGKERQEAKPGEPIPEGKRDSTLTSLAGSMRKRGMTQAAIEAALLVENRDRCQPPLEDEQVAKIARSVSRYEPEQRAASVAPRIISAIDLMEKEFPPLIFAIPGIIPEGFTLLAGKPKAGKSFLALEAAYSVALGKNLLDKSEIERGGALVLGLEDGERRMNQRIGMIDSSDVFILSMSTTEAGGIHIIATLGDIKIPEGLDISVMWPRIGSGGIEELEKYLDEHPDIRLVVIDTIKRFTKRKGKGQAYDEDYDSVQPLQELATRRGLPIIGVCHTRKAVAEDSLDNVSGTFGLTGAVDSILVLQKESDKEFRLSIYSRDMESRDLAVRFEDNCMWTLMGDADDYFIGEEREKILECLMDSGPMKPLELADSLGKNRNTTRALLAKMLRDGKVIKDSKGRYSGEGRSK